MATPPETLQIPLSHDVDVVGTMLLMFKAFKGANRNHQALICNLEAGEQLCGSESVCEELKSLAKGVMEVLVVFKKLYQVVVPGL